MKASLVVCAIFVVVLAFGGEAAPPAEEFPQRSAFDFEVFKPAVADHADRHRRVTCDLLSFDTKWGSINHAACAAHCLALLKGYRGGHCDANGVCVCRK